MKFIFILLFNLIGVAFLTLMERKILSYIHFRYGPNKMIFLGLFQPFSDALKLFSKEDFKLKEVFFNVYFIFSFLALFTSLFFWGLMSFWGVVFFSSFSMVQLICLIGVGVFFLLFMGWSSSAKFSLLGSYRSSAQSVSYEVIMILVLLFMFYFWFSLNLVDYFNMSLGVMLVFQITILFYLWVLSCMAECNRSPFDFSEGESELVSGFNTEYSGGLFSMIFISEYSSIIIFSYFSSLLFTSYFIFFFSFLLVIFFYLWVRGSFPRLRYDLLMYMAWKSLLTLSLFYFFTFIVFFS